MERPITEIDLKKEEKELIDGKLQDLMHTCQVFHAPMFAAVVTKNNEEGTEYDNIVLNARSHDITLKDDQIRKHMLIADGFSAVPPREDRVYDPLGVLDTEPQEKSE